jgi:hypothetical protein
VWKPTPTHCMSLAEWIRPGTATGAASPARQLAAV